jgi:SecD/SecF fusion protein
LSLLAGLVLVFAVGLGAYGFLTFSTFSRWREISLWEESYKEAQQEAKDKNNPAILEKFFFGPADPDPRKLCAKLAPELKEQFSSAREAGTEALDGFFKTHVLPNRWIPWLYLLGLVVAAPLLSFGSRGLFQKHNRRMWFIIALSGLLGGYFSYLAGNNIYPMGIDLAGGTELIYRLDFTDVDRRLDEANQRLAELTEGTGEQKEEEIRKLRSMVEALRLSRDTAPEKAAEVVRKRVDPTGTKGIPITSYDEGRRIRIQLPRASPEEVERIKRAIRTQGRLTFHLCADEMKDREIIEKVKDPNNTTREYKGYKLMVIETKDPYDPTNVRRYEEIVDKVPMLEGSRVVFAGTARSQEGGFEVRLQFDAAGSARFEEVTAANVNRKMAIVLDGTCYSAPVIKERIAGECRISGSFTQQQANDLASILTAGSLPAEVAPESEFTVGPALGNEQIESGMVATIAAGTVVAVFMWGYYRLGGFITVMCMFINLVVLMGALGFFKATMTLPGIAGIALTFGMAVDANVLIFERIREEQARGRPFRLAVQLGFDRAFSAIIDSNLTTLLSGIIMYYIGTGPVRGFAVTLSVGILVTLFANLWVFRQMLEWLVSREAVPTLKMFQALRETHIDFMALRRPWYFISGTAALSSLAAFVALGVFNDRIYDLDFTGGTLVQFNFAKGKEQADADVKRAAEEVLQPKLKERLAAVAAKLTELAASGKKQDEIRTAVYEQVPEVVRSHMGAGGEITTEQLQRWADTVKKTAEDFARLRLTVQSFGNPEPGTESRYRSFSLTTRETDPVVVQAIVGQLLKTFEGKVEPDAVAVAGDAVRIHFQRKAGEAAGSLKSESCVFEAEHARDQLAASKELDASLQAALKALKASPAQVVAEGESCYVDLAPLPADPIQRDQVRVAFLETRIAHQAEGPIGRQSSFGSQVAGELRGSAVLALLGSLVGIFLYLWFRFEFSGAWGFGAIVALLHDAMVAVGAVCLVSTLGIIPILIDLNLVAAVLTIIGFSVNDTIVIFDRIREVKAAHPTRALGEVVNESVNATLSRTILTTSTALVATLMLFLFGGPTIRDLTFTLLVGMVAGVYSTVFIASPLMMWWYRRYGATFATYAPQPGGEAAPSGAQL